MKYNLYFEIWFGKNVEIGQSTGWSSSKHSHDWTNRKKANTMTKLVLAPGKRRKQIPLQLIPLFTCKLESRPIIWVQCFGSDGFLLFSSKMWRENAAKFKTNGRRTICLRCHILHYPFAKQQRFYEIKTWWYFQSTSTLKIQIGASLALKFYKIWTSETLS